MAAQHGDPWLIKRRALWIAQGLLALVFLFAGASKLVLQLAALTQQLPLPGLFLRLVGAAEVVGEMVLVMPGLLRLVSLAAGGLVAIMIGAAGATLVQMGAAPALVAVAVGLLAAFVACGRWRLGDVSGRVAAKPRARMAL